MTEVQPAAPIEAKWLAVSMSCPQAAWSFPAETVGSLEVRNQFQFSFVEQDVQQIICKSALQVDLLSAQTNKQVGHAHFETHIGVVLLGEVTATTIREDELTKKEFTEHCVALAVGYLRTLVFQASALSGTEFQIVLPPMSLPVIGTEAQIEYRPSTLT